MSKAAETLFRKARDHAARRNFTPAIEAASAAAKLDPSRKELWTFLGELHFNTGQFGKATEALRSALRASGGEAGAFHNLGVALKREGAWAEAEAMLREAWRRDGTNTGTVLSLSDLLVSSARRGEAQTLLTSCLTRNPENFDYARELNNLLIQEGRYSEAMTQAEAFIARNGQSIPALEQLSVAYQCVNRLDEALEITAATIKAAPSKTLDIRLANYLSIAGRTARLAHRAQARALLLPALVASLPEQDRARWMFNDTNALRRLSFLLPYYGIDDRLLMRVFTAIGDMLHARIPRLPEVKHRPSSKLRVGFVSYNFSEHPIGHLLSPFFEQHGTTGTDLYLYALHLNHHDPNDYAGRIRATTKHYRDCRGMTAAQLAAKIRDDNISILIDLDGYLGGGLLEAFAMRPAPVQIHWLQHLAGMPAPYIDYTIVDRVLVQDDERDNGNGPLIRLADAFQCGDRVTLPKGEPKRADHGLPEEATVFCAFGNWLKIDEEVFTCWIDILKGVPDSVLWLSDGPSDKSRELLRDRLATNGIARERLIFALRVPSKAEHIHRHKCADLFLDTFTFSAATTTTDALWAGLPVLTRPGFTGQSRLSASLLEAVGMKDTIVRDAKAYVAFAIRVGKSKAQSDMLKRKLARLLPESKLYDAARLVAQFKDIYARVWEQYESGKAPEHMDI
jgi:predicted O-linked N-acetylglucosamine transferase (SPINDLY family)